MIRVLQIILTYRRSSVIDTLKQVSDVRDILALFYRPLGHFLFGI